MTLQKRTTTGNFSHFAVSLATLAVCRLNHTHINNFCNKSQITEGCLKCPGSGMTLCRFIGQGCTVSTTADRTSFGVQNTGQECSSLLMLILDPVMNIYEISITFTYLIL